MSPLHPFGLRLDLPEGTSPRSLDRDELLSLVAEHKLILIRGLQPMSRDELLEFAADDIERDLIHWSFGPVMEMKVDPSAQNYLFTREAVPFHWDGAFHEEPRILLFQCLEAPSPELGGATFFCNTELAYEAATEELRKSWEKITLTYETEKKAHYGGSFSTPMVVRKSGRQTLRYAEPVETALNPVKLTIQGLKGEREEFLAQLRASLYAAEHTYAHAWREGDILLADNQNLLHGRMPFSAACPRHLRRIQLR